MRIRHWKLKALIQLGLSTLPGGQVINDRLQTAMGELRSFDANIGRKVEDWAGLMSLLASARSRSVEGAALVEIGSGWYPTLPVCFALAGARTVHTVDIVRHFDPSLCKRMIAALEPHLGRIASVADRPEDRIRVSWAAMRDSFDLPSLLAQAGIVYHAPQDARHMSGIADGTLDLVYSNSVLEHIPPDVLDGILSEARRMLGDGDLTLHGVACNDHYAHFDRRISFVNYLQYADRRWRLYNNDLHYQNRLRARDFLDTAERCGFDVIDHRTAVRPGSREALGSMQIAPEFASYSLEELAITTVDFVARKRQPAAKVPA